MKILVAASNMVHINNFHLPYIKAFKEAGNEVYVMASGEGADFDIPFKKRALSLGNYRLSKKIRRIIKEGSFDVIFLHTTLAAFWVRYALKGLKQRPRVINTVHGYLFGKTSSWLHNLIYLRLEKGMRKQTDNIIVMNDEDYQIAKKNNLSLEKTVKIDGMGFNPPMLEYQEKNGKNLTFIGEISKRKNQTFLIKALRLLPEYNLTLVGDGKERASAEKLAKKEKVASRVRITGYTKDISSYLKNTDVYVSASKIEGLPFNVLEAMSVGLPIVASDIKGHSDLLFENCLFELDNVKDFVDKVREKSLKKTEYNIAPYLFENAFFKNMRIYTDLMNQ